MMKKVHYGLDAPLVPISYLVIGLGILINWVFFHQYAAAGFVLLYALLLIAGGLIFFHTSFRGKFIIWDKILAKTDISDDATVLDLGCGHGAVLIALSKLLGPFGKAVGVDLWKNADQSHNSLEETKRNLEIAKVADHTELVTADMAKLPFEDDRFDLVTSSFAFHNIKPNKKRFEALSEAHRVLKPGGKLIIVDTGHHKTQYINFLKKSSEFSDVSSENTGFNGWWTGPWMASYVIEATKK
ncbi:methyltransferase domain-containing protein [Lentilactobacillus hilgardii]|uniref:Methyltransferase domain-containing protein n=2 Tax=Lentilactobacillus hilgardii TaxID=1588 RepID=A0A6P1E9C2_LENHI|nr:class I SAM-dependent methyltransferase [Lentilactobacillus hilgardii]EEI72611.1 methyltransferase domain protein [Lentilactobacillus hilgardii ATCC 27305]MCT3391305.1 class I SAM-dependent methyltransferase [Lentilactobacillus hilgardii]QHB53199.1 methyltransferase domain-containing protein [Lentilactobacillus hilgardii]RRG11279.1 MAG: class I SAM-dependent methyltransferase [Lactobacillus sp.]